MVDPNNFTLCGDALRDDKPLLVLLALTQALNKCGVRPKVFPAASDRLKRDVDVYTLALKVGHLLFA